MSAMNNILIFYKSIGFLARKLQKSNCKWISLIERELKFPKMSSNKIEKWMYKSFSQKQYSRIKMQNARLEIVHSFKFEFFKCFKWMCFSNELERNGKKFSNRIVEMISNEYFLKNEMIGNEMLFLNPHWIWLLKVVPLKYSYGFLVINIDQI